MKRIITLILSLLLILMIGVTAFAKDNNTKNGKVYTFFGNCVTNIDYDGKTFVGLKSGKIVYSSNFEQWNWADLTLPDVYWLRHIGGKFVAVNSGVTLISSDGIEWQVHENDLPITSLKIAEKDGILLATGSVIDSKTKQEIGSTYYSRDGISWKLSSGDIPHGCDIRVVGDYFAMMSDGYMPGTYASRDGTSFTKVEIPRSELTYYAGQYHAFEWDDNDKTYIYSSNDLVDWDKQPIEWIEGEMYYPYYGTFVTDNDGNEYAFNLSGNQLKYDPKSRGWRQGDMTAIRDELPYTQFVYYNQSEHGLFAWSSASLCSYWLADNLTITKTFDNSTLNLDYITARDGKFYVFARGDVNKTQSNYTIYTSVDAQNWTVDDTLDIDNPYEFSLPAPDNGVIYEEFDNPAMAAIYQCDDYCIMNVSGRYYICFDGVTRYPILLKVPYRYCAANNIIIRVADNNLIEQLPHAEYDKITNPENYPPSAKIKLYDTYLSFTMPPIIKDGNVIVPLRFVVETMGGSVDYKFISEQKSDGQWDIRGQLTIHYKKQEITVRSGSDVAEIDGKRVVMEGKAQLINGKAYVPYSLLKQIIGDALTIEY